MPFCPRCNTSLENYMQFCWNCGNRQVGGQPPMQPQPQQVQVIQPQPVQQYQQPQQGYYTQQQGFVAQQPGQTYPQTVTITYGGAGGMGMGPQPHHQHMGGPRQQILECKFCEGEGHHPMNFDQPCPVCRGAGNFSIQEPFSDCKQCNGSGKKFATMDQMCQACQGRGVIHLQ